jgi:TrmH family RNA methyltransferase
MDIITSNSNKTIQLVKKLYSDKKYRDETNMFVVETYRVIKQLLINEYKFNFLIIANNSKYLNDFKNKENVYVVNEHIFDSISNVVNTDGIIGVFNKIKNNFVFQQNKKYIILDKIQNPNNLGSIIRNCVAFNIDGIIVTNDSVDIYNINVIRSSMGAVFFIPIKFSTSLIQIIKELKENQYKIYATAIENTATDLKHVKFEKNSAIIFGNEGNGINKNDLKLCDEIIYIPINNKIDSLNIASSVSIVL